MDNFMDKLSNRFHAGELIRANGEAEAKQIQSLKQQNEQQAEILSQVRRLNLKTVEISEQVSQMAALSIQRLEEFELQVQKQESEEKTPDQEAVKESVQGIGSGSGWELEIYQGMSQLHTELQNIENLESSLLAFQESQTEHNSKVSELIQQTLDMQNRPTSWQTEVWQSMSLMQQQLENIEHALSSQATLQEQLQSAQAISQDQNRKILEHIDENKNCREKPSFIYGIEASLSEIENNAENGRRETLSRFDQIMQKLASPDNEAATKAIADAIAAENEKTSQTLIQIKELVVGLRVYLDEVEKRTEDFVHKEDVKVYRNVQATVMETVSARSRDLGDRIDSIEKKTDSLKGVKPLLLITLLSSLATVAITVLQLLGIL